MFDAKNLLNQVLGAPKGESEKSSSGGNFGGIAGGALAGGLAGLVTGTKTGRKIGKNALKYGGVALLGGLAYKAWNDWQSGKGASPAGQSAAQDAPAIAEPPAGSRFLPQTEEQQDLSLSLVRAMIAATKADGNVSADEQQRIFRHVNELDLDAEGKAFIMDELARPLDIDAVASGASCSETAAEIYAASLIAIDRDGPAERGYLSLLAARLNLDPSLVDHLHANVDRAMA